jgi:hypothetical protein
MKGMVSGFTPICCWFRKDQCGLCPLAQVLPRPQLIFPSKTWFFGICLNFQLQKSLKNISHILDPNLTKSIPLNPSHQDLSNSTKGTFQFLQNFQL